MPRTILSSGLDALESGRLGFAWLLDIETDEGTLSGTSLDDPVTYNSTNYDPLGDTITIPEITLASGIVPQPIAIELSAVEIKDTTSFVGRFNARTYHNRRITLRGLLLDADSLAVIAEAFVYRGFIDSVNIDEGTDSTLTINVEGGLFRALSSNTHILGHRDQIRRAPGDIFLFEIEKRVGAVIPFGIGREYLKK